MGQQEEEILAGILGGVAQGVGGFSQGYAASKHLTAQEQHLKRLEEMQDRDREDARRMDNVTAMILAKMSGVPMDDAMMQQLYPGYTPPAPPPGPEFMQGEPFDLRTLDYGNMLVPGGLPKRVPKNWGPPREGG